MSGRVTSLSIRRPHCSDPSLRRRAVFKGTRVLLRTVLASLAAGDAAENILTDFPSLKADDVRAAIAFAAASARGLPIRCSHIQ